MPQFSTGTDALYGWTPTSTAAYAGTCIFLIFLAAVPRFLIASKSAIKQRHYDVQFKRRQQSTTSRTESPRTFLKENGIEEDVTVVRHNLGDTRPWSAAVDGPGAVFSTILAGVIYLL